MKRYMIWQDKTNQNNMITIGEFLVVSIVSILGYVLIKTIVQTIKSK